MENKETLVDETENFSMGFRKIITPSIKVEKRIEAINGEIYLVIKTLEGKELHRELLYKDIK